MTSDRKDKHFRIPIKFMDADSESEDQIFSDDNEEDIPLGVAHEIDRREFES